VCRQAIEMVTDYLDDALPNTARRRLELHLADCPHCHEYFEQIRVTIAAVGQVEPADLSSDARSELVGLYQRWTAEA
jgi:anti-sigma factor RsiW